MLFHTSTFFVFFIAFVACYAPVRRKPTGIWVILIFSNIFYGWWNWKYLLLLWATIIVDFALAKLIDKTDSPLRRKWLLAASLISNFGILTYFKYFNFFVDLVASVGVPGATKWHILDLVLPVGISFYVFQSMSYTLDVYRRKQKPINSLIQFAGFVCYFPQLVAGPIERLNHLLPQLIAPARFSVNAVISGGFLFCFGLFRKAIADTFGSFVDPVFNNIGAATPAEAVFAIFGFGLQIYLDFSGYVDMARGISRVLGIELTLNFNAPYLSTSPREFWRRWHISLSEWLRDYLYISLGGNRHGQARHLLALMVTMLLGGLWHGAGLNFVVWGGLHGLYLCANVAWSGLAKGRRSQTVSTRHAVLWPDIVMNVLGWLLTFIAVNYAWLYFRCHTFQSALDANRKIVEWVQHPQLPVILPALAAMCFLVICMEFALRFKPNALQVFCTNFTLPRAVIAGLVGGPLFAASVVLLAGFPTQQFIYFQF